MGINDRPDFRKLAINAALTGDNILIPAGLATQGIIVWKLILVVGAATVITFKDGAAAESGGIPLVANGSISLPYDGAPWFTAGSGNAFISNSNGTTVQQSGIIWFTYSPNNIQP